MSSAPPGGLSTNERISCTNEHKRSTNKCHGFKFKISIGRCQHVSSTALGKSRITLEGIEHKRRDLLHKGAQTEHKRKPRDKSLLFRNFRLYYNIYSYNDTRLFEGKSIENIVLIILTLDKKTKIFINFQQKNLLSSVNIFVVDNEFAAILQFKVGTLTGHKFDCQLFKIKLIVHNFEYSSTKLVINEIDTLLKVLKARLVLLQNVYLVRNRQRLAIGILTVQYKERNWYTNRKIYAAQLTQLVHTLSCMCIKHAISLSFNLKS
ncbi:hypothetical protein AGLY_018084 [Aphis glycines]|uniref:Uncharacterized protein n=1 Tax=Aphis glycines TaxID=307491 RepID=A0A6G0STP8_APHGL|nr:hypothetical protein AGLY_018084 [Aphis glycines]